MATTGLTILTSALAILAAVAVAVSARLDSLRVRRTAVMAGWGGVLVAAGASAFSTFGGLGALLAAAGCGAVAAIPLDARGERTSGQFVIPVATATTAGLSGLTVALLPTPEAWEAAATLYIVLFAGLGAVLSLFGAGAGRGAEVRARTPGGWIRRLVNGGFVGAGILVAIGSFAVIRSPSATSGGLPLVGHGGEPLFWSLPDAVTSAPTTAWTVAVPLPAVWVWIAMAIGVIAVIWSLADPFIPSRVSRAGWGVLGGTILVASGWFAGLIPSYVELPGSEAFVSRAEVVLSNAELPERLAERGAFSASGARANWFAILPALMGLCWSAVVSLGFAMIERVEADEAKASGWISRPAGPAIRACMVLWACWFVAGLIHWRLAGVTGFQSPSEWMALGTACLATGISLVSIEHASAATDRLEAQTSLSLGAAGALTVVFVATALAVWTGVPPLLSVPA